MVVLSFIIKLLPAVCAGCNSK